VLGNSHLIQSGSKSILSLGYTAYDVDNIGVITDGSGSVDTSARTWGRARSTDTEDWLILDFQSHELKSGSNYVLAFPAVTFHNKKISSQTWTTSAGSIGSGGYVDVGIDNTMSVITNTFDIDTLTDANIPGLDPMLGGTFCQSIRQSVAYGVTITDAASDDYAAQSFCIDVNSTTYDIYGIVFKSTIQRERSKINESAKYDCDLYFEITNDAIQMWSIS
jgi:hypothetical protein